MAGPAFVILPRGGSMVRWLVCGLSLCASAAAAQSVPPGKRADSSTVHVQRYVLLATTAQDTAAIRRAAVAAVPRPDTVPLWRISVRIEGDTAHATVPNNVAGGTMVTVRRLDGKWVADSVRVFFSR